jgi:hypothetical protein
VQEHFCGGRAKCSFLGLMVSGRGGSDTDGVTGVIVGDGEEQAALTLEVVQRMGWSPAEVWLHYMGMGGGVDEFEVNAYLYGLLHLPAHERDAVTHAVNELYEDAYRNGRAPYSSDLSRTKRREP